MASRDEQMERLIGLAGQLEKSSEVQARIRQIERRQQLIHLDWREPRRPGVLYAVDPMPKIVARRSVSKMCAQDYTLHCRADGHAAMLQWQTDNALDALAPEQDQQMLQDLKKRARDRADRIEAAARGLLQQIEQQQRISLVRALARQTTLGFAGPLRMGYDESALAEPGTVPLYIQLLDPRSYFYVPETKAGHGARMVIYKRRARKQSLEMEGWNLTGDSRIENIDPDVDITIYDCWEKVRTKKKVQLFHCIIADGGDGGRRFLKPPMDMAQRGLYCIPYVFRPVSPAAFLDDAYPKDASESIVDVFDANWELQNLTMSFMAQLMALSVDPPTLQKTHAPTELDVATPGAQNQVLPDEDARIMPNEYARQDISMLHQTLESKMQRGTFSGANYGEGAQQMSGLMTGRLQQAGEEPIGDPKEAVELALGDTFDLLAKMTAIYLSDLELAIPLGATEAGMLDPNLFSGTESFIVYLPGMTPLEQAQTAQNFKSLTEPDSKGARFMSPETARQLSKVVPYEHVESERILSQDWRDIVLEEARESRLQAKVQVENTINQQRMMLAAQQQMAQSMGNPQAVEPQGPPGVAQSPLPETAPMPLTDFQPAQLQRGA